MTCGTVGAGTGRPADVLHRARGGQGDSQVEAPPRWPRRGRRRSGPSRRRCRRGRRTPAPRRARRPGPGIREIAAAWRSLVSARAQGRARRRSAAPSSSGARRGARARCAVAPQPVALGIHGRGGQAALAEGEDPVVAAAAEHRGEPSPRPEPMAVPPPAGRARRCRGPPPAPRARRASGRGPRAVAGHQRGAASAEPPAMPPATGMSLRIVMCTGSSTPPASARRWAARAARLVPSIGTPSARGPCDRRGPTRRRRRR